jgi:hypothetical protein
MNRLKTTPVNKYTGPTVKEINEILISYAVLIGGFIGLFILICQVTKF